MAALTKYDQSHEFYRINRFPNFVILEGDDGFYAVEIDNDALLTAKAVFPGYTYAAAESCACAFIAYMGAC